MPPPLPRQTDTGLPLGFPHPGSLLMFPITSASALPFSRLARCSLTLRPVHSLISFQRPFHRRLRRLRCRLPPLRLLPAEAVIAGWDCSPTEVVCLFTAHWKSRLGEYQPRTWNRGRSAFAGAPIPEYCPTIIEEELWEREQGRRKEITPGRLGRSVISTSPPASHCSSSATAGLAYRDATGGGR